jgi:hypothetical protein
VGSKNEYWPHGTTQHRQMENGELNVGSRHFKTNRDRPHPGKSWGRVNAVLAGSATSHNSLKDDDHVKALDCDLASNRRIHAAE